MAAPSPPSLASTSTSSRDPEFVAFLATTVDGSIARPDGNMDFLEAAHATMTPAGKQDCGFAAFMASVHAIVMGSRTFLHVLASERVTRTKTTTTTTTTNEGEGEEERAWPYGHTPLYVVSGSLTELPADSPPSVQLVKSRNLPDVVILLQQQRLLWEQQIGQRSKDPLRVYVDGGELVRSFITARLLSEITITVIPKVLGHGKRLFGGTQDVDLVLKDSRHWDFGFVQSRYQFEYS